MDRSPSSNPLLRRLLSLRLRLLRFVGRPVIVSHRNHLIEIDPRDAYIGFELLVLGTWEEPLVSAIERLPLDGKTAVDVGAHVGIHTITLSGLVGQGGRVVALEPDPINFGRLVRNLRRNDAANVTALNLAASATQGNAWLERQSPNLGGHRIVRVETDIPVGLVPIDDLVDPGTVGFVKIDVEGHEHEVLDGMQRVVTEAEGLTLMVELELVGTRGLDASIRTLRRLDGLGYAATVLDEGYRRLSEELLVELAGRVERINVFFSRDRSFITDCLGSRDSFRE